MERMTTEQWLSRWGHWNVPVLKAIQRVAELLRMGTRITFEKEHQKERFVKTCSEVLSDLFSVTDLLNLDSATMRAMEAVGGKALARGEKADSLRAMPYADYLKTPEWQETRTEALERSGHKCQVCNNGDAQLDVHHRTYERRGNERSEDLVVLCHKCHGKFHDALPAEPNK